MATSHSERLDDPPPEGIEMQRDELGDAISVPGIHVVAQDTVRGIDHGKFAITHLDDIDPAVDDGGAESETGEKRGIEGFGGVRKGRDLFLPVGSERLLEEIVPEVDVAGRFESGEHGVTADTPAKADGAAARITFLLLAEGRVHAADGPDKTPESVEIEGESGPGEELAFAFGEDLLELGPGKDGNG